MIEGINEEYINILEPLFIDGGFKKFINDGVVLNNIDFGPAIDGSAATAIIHTGAAPTVNGIFSDERYDIKKQSVSHILKDTTNKSINLLLSPQAIGVSTLSDEIRLDASGTGWVYSIAPNASQAIITAGHTGNNAYWIDDKTGQWVSSSYYKETAAPMSNRNFRKPLSTVLDTLVWSPLIEPEKYPFIPEYKIQYPFKYTFTRKNEERFIQFKESAKVNSEISNLACEFINNMQFGTRGPIDMLNLTFTVAPFRYSNNSDNRMELLDSYLRLDRDIATVIDAVDKKIGLNNALIFIVGYPANKPFLRDDEKWKIPSGDFSPRKAISLLNMYLMALHGNGNWVLGYFNRNFYLNHDLIKEKQLEISNIRNEAAEFLTKMSGVSNANTIEDILFNRGGDNPSSLKRNISLKNSGDIIIDIIPGWSVIDDVNNEVTKKPQVFRDNNSTSIAMILSPGIKPQIINETVDARKIAPTIARLAHIRTPNAASLAPLRL